MNGIAKRVCEWLALGAVIVLCMGAAFSVGVIVYLVFWWGPQQQQEMQR